MWASGLYQGAYWHLSSGIQVHLQVCMYVFSIIGFVVQGATRLFREVDTFMSIPKLLQRSA